MNESTKTSAQPTGPKFRENGIMEKRWLDGNILQFTFLDRSSLRFDRRLAAAGNRDNAERMGWQQRLGDLGAIEVRDFPDRMARSLEAKRVIARGIQHYQGPSSDWNIPAERTPAYVPTEADVREVLKAVYGDKADTLFAGVAKMHPGESGGVDAKAALAFLTASKEGARAWATIQADRRRGDAAPGAEDLLAKMMAAAGA